MSDTWRTPADESHEIGLEPTAPAEISVVDDLPRRRIFNLDFVDCADMAEVADAIINRLEPAGPCQLPCVVTPNVDIIVQMTQRPDSVETGVLLGSQFCLPDGQPIVMASRLLDRPLATRLAGRLLFTELWPRFIDQGIPVTVIASSEDVAGGLADQHPKANAIVAPMLDREDQEGIDRLAAEVVDDARRLGTRFVLSGIGFPKDLLIAESVFRQWPADAGEPPMAMGLGASFAFHLGLTDKAPDWVVSFGMEWFHRFLQEPRRLFHRYFIRDVRFLPLVFDEWRVAKRRKGVSADG